MDSTKDRIYTIGTALLVGLAVIIGGMAIHQEFFDQPDMTTGLQFVEGWDDITTGSYVEGNEEAPITILKFYDYQCPFCKQINAELEHLFEKYPSQIKIQYVHNPLANHEYAYPAAKASECARKQQMFKPFHHVLFNYQTGLDTLSLINAAEKAGVNDLERFSSCIENNMTAEIVNEHLSLSEELYIDAIPTLIVNGWIIEGAAPFEYLDKMIVYLSEV